MGIYEILNITKAIKEAILAKATTTEIKKIAIDEGFRTMQDMGRQMLISGDLNYNGRLFYNTGKRINNGFIRLGHLNAFVDGEIEASNRC